MAHIYSFGLKLGVLNDIWPTKAYQEGILYKHPPKMLWKVIHSAYFVYHLDAR